MPSTRCFNQILDLCLLRKTKSQVWASFAWICELRRDFSRIRLIMHTFESMSNSLIFSADVHKFVICGCYANLGRRKKVSNAICCTTTNYELLHKMSEFDMFSKVCIIRRIREKSRRNSQIHANLAQTCDFVLRKRHKSIGSQSNETVLVRITVRTCKMETFPYEQSIRWFHTVFYDVDMETLMEWLCYACSIPSAPYLVFHMGVP